MPPTGGLLEMTMTNTCAFAFSELFPTVLFLFEFGLRSYTIVVPIKSNSCVTNEPYSAGWIKFKKAMNKCLVELN